MASADSHSGRGDRAWRLAGLPLVAFLGVVLPLAFLRQLEDLLYYLRPSDLAPTYGTAWLLLALVGLPIWLLLALALKALGALKSLRALRDLAAIALIAAASAAALGALLYCLLIWVQSLGWLRALSFARQLLWVALAAGALIGCTRQGRSLVDRSRGIALGCALLGALSTLSLPFFLWRSAAPPAPADPPASATARLRAPPHIILLTIDALSAEHMSLYGAARATTPMLASFAQEATTFERAYANANFTTPGVASIMTGTRPWSHRALQLASWPLEDTRRVSLPALLRQSGYQTGYVSTNAAAGAAKNGLASYFEFASRDRIGDLNLCTDELSSLFKYICPVAAMPLFAQLVALADAARGGLDLWHYDPRLAIEPALAWLKSVDKSKPVFLWVHLYPPHSPYAAPAPWLGRFDASSDARRVSDSEPQWGFALGAASGAQVRVLRARYDESVAYVDYYAGEFLRRASQLLGDNTVLVVTADHGESFRHGFGAHTGPGMYDEIIHVPLIIRLPGQTQAIRSALLAEQVDIAPTLLELAGVSAPPLWEGRSLLTAWSSAQGVQQRAAKAAFSMNFEQNPRFSALHTGVVAVVEGRWKLVHYMGRLEYPLMPPLQDALYDLAIDPAESASLAAGEPLEVGHLRSLIEAQLAQHGGAVH